MSEYGLPYRAQPRALLTITRCQPMVARPPRPENLRQWVKFIGKGIAQSFRLMVGVQDYPNYVRHMQVHHPEKTPMTEKEFHRYCLNARFPSEAGKLGKCPC
ncbi:YbdD/YjiX family protein [Rouxiella badensis]|uniref:Selenoprotein n=1 Tax=Rouxiella badensis TaxID=1646377 RepID=A0A1X0W9C8_9GAMM|nr:CstA-like transporter-associated (seleno)protein [Rouxiella badensis]MCC3717998.1 putative selenoprotein [Rouxiella badensis]MCC3729987.1 putative selenoprotein [Rouxiella badensis]MCC3734240.1 putative selenoprotein [Rouxiella badensis]MCC3739277.1 putative selenoprotein [Rouxiella badensis]MCC3747233.1 putative selenoprotein [Rouxiella badensis]